MSKILTQIKYTQLIRDIKAILNNGLKDSSLGSAQRILMINWEVGKCLSTSLPMKAIKDANNERIIRQIAREFSQPDVYFYAVIKLYQYYPKLELESPYLTWPHYQKLINVDDNKRRQFYEGLVRCDHLTPESLSELISSD